MEIENRINQEQIKIITEKGYEPKFVYLGSEEFKEFIDYVMDSYEFPIRPKSEEGLEFLGLRIMEVKIKNHFNVV